MRILLSTKYSLDKPIGSSVIALRHARMLREKGHTVAIFCPEEDNQQININGTDVFYYAFDRQQNFLFNRCNRLGKSNIKRSLTEFNPDLLYDVHGPTWAIEEASNFNIPVFSMVGDYNHLCLLNFLVTPKLIRCDGPSSYTKCIRCIKSSQPLKTRITSVFFKRKFLSSIITLILGNSRANRWDYRSAAFEAFTINETIRNKVKYYIIGDKQAQTIFSKFVDPQKFILNQQFFPSELQERINMNLKRNSNDMLIFGYVGSLDSYKGFSILLKAFLELDNYINIELWVVHKFDATTGNILSIRSKKAKLKFLVNSHKIKCLNPQNDESLFEIMSNFSIGVIPSIAYETPSQVLMELISNSVPVIRSESDGMNHLIQNKINGLTYQYDDYLDLAEKIKYVIDNPSVILRWKENLPILRTQNDYYKTLSPYFESDSIVNK